MVRRSSSRIRLGNYANPALRGLVVASGAVALSGCDDPDVGQVATYTSVAECRADGLVSAAQCELAEREARADHFQVAPRYQSLDDCQIDYERCEPARDEVGGSWFVPFFAGYIVSEIIDEVGDAARRKRYHPVYRTRDFGYVTSGGFYMPGTGRYPVSRSGYEGIAARPSSVERFGLGQSQTATRGGVGDLSTRASYGGSSVSGSRSSISRGGFGSSGGSGRGG